MAIALRLIEQRRARLQQVLRAATGGNGSVKGLMTGIPKAEHLFAVLNLQHLREAMGAGNNLRLPSVVTPRYRQAENQRLQMGAGIVDVCQLSQPR